MANLKQLYTLPNYDIIHGELKKVGVTLKLLWKAYKVDCESWRWIAIYKNRNHCNGQTE